MSALLAPSSMAPPARGHARIACGTSCGVFVERSRRPGTIWNLSVVGVYVVMPEPLPPVGARVLLTFALPGERALIACLGRIRWLNAPSIFKGCGSAKPSLPPGCGVEFVELDEAARRRIAALLPR
jgi:hypothetical protein